MVEQLNAENFAANAKGLALVDFWAEWCGPCKKMAPVFEKLAPTYNGKPHFFKINVDENQALAEQFNISGIPCLVMFKEGKEVGRIVGFYPEDGLKQKIDELVSRVG